LNTYIRALKEFPLDEKTGEEAPRLAASVDGGWETLANAYADVLGLHTDPKVQRAVGKRLAKTFEDELGDIAKAEETYKYVLGVEPLDIEALANLDRIYLSLEAWADLAHVLEMRVKAGEAERRPIPPPTASNSSSSTIGSARSTNRASTILRMPSARTGGSSTTSRDRTAARLQRSRRIYERLEAWHELNVVYERELENAAGDTAEAEIRAKLPTSPRYAWAAAACDRHLEARTRSAWRGCRGTRGAREPL
jgi:hypothetical protein